MGRSSNDEPRSSRRNSHEDGSLTPSRTPSRTPSISSSQMPTRVSSSGSGFRLFHRSPQKQNQAITATTSSQAQDLLGELHREEKIRDAAGAMLAELEYGVNQPNKYYGNNMIKQLNNSLKSDSHHRKKVRAQFDSAEVRIQQIREQLMELGVEEDDDLSSGDEDGVNNSSMFFNDDYYNLSEEETSKSNSTNNNQKGGSSHYLYQMGGSSSAASSALDLSTANSSRLEVGSDSQTMTRSPSMSLDTATRHIMRILESLEPQSRDSNIAVDRIQELVCTVPSLRHELRSTAPWGLVSDCIKPFLLDKDAGKVALGLKLTRVFMLDSSALTFFRNALLLDYILVQVLAKDDQNRNHESRLSAIQLIREMANIHGGLSGISRGVCCAIIAAAEQSNDGIRHICTETLAELVVADPERVFEVGGLTVLLSAITQPGDEIMNGRTGDGNGGGGATGAGAGSAGGAGGAATASSNDNDISTCDNNCAFALAVAIILVGAADRSDIRNRFFRNGKDLSSLLTPFTDVDLYGSLKTSKDFMMQSSTAMQVILRSWVGVICFDLNLFVQCMTLPLSEIQETLLNVLDGVLWLPSLPDNVLHGGTSANNSERLSHQFTAILLHRLQILGLQEKLVRLQSDGLTESICRKAQQIGAKIFALSAKLIPRHAIVKQSMALPKELEEALAKAPPYSLPTASIALFGTEAELPSISTWRSAPSLQNFIRLGVNIDDFSFKKLVHSTHVLETKMFRQWNWDALMELVQGPLRSPKRLDEVTRGSKFLKRLFAFYRPFKYRFSNLTITREHTRYVEVGKELMKSLLETHEGIRYLAQNKLFRQIAECLAQLDPLSGIVSNEPLLSVRRFKSTLCCAYSELIGVLSRSVVGQQILAQIRIFNMFYRVCDINREDVTRSIICALDYRLEGHPRLILAKALTVTSKSTRLYATEFVGYKLATEEAHLWAIDLMVEQLYDVDISVAQAAAYGLHNMCAASAQALDYTIGLKPFLGHLQEAAEPLRILFMSRPQGFDILLAEFEHRDMSHWAPGFNEAYVDKIETYLEYVNTNNIKLKSEQAKIQDAEYFSFPQYSRPSKRQFHNGTLSAPAHFYGELALTDQGCRFLQSKGGLMEIKTLVEKAAQSLNKNWSAESLRKIKGALWAIGHVASREKGGALLEMSDVENICAICRESAILSLRGTAYYVLGLFALSTSGAELIHQCKWDVVYDSYGRPVGVVLPPENYYHSETVGEADHESFKRSSMHHLSPLSALRPRSSSLLTLAASPPVATDDISNSSKIMLSHPSDEPAVEADHTITEHEFPPPLRISRYAESPTSPSHGSTTSSQAFDFDIGSPGQRSLVTDPRKEKAIEEVLNAIVQLGSSVHSSNAAKALVAMRASHPNVFQSGEALKAVQELFSTGHYKLVLRRFVFGLFDTRVCLEKLYRRSKHSTN